MGMGGRCHAPTALKENKKKKVKQSESSRRMRLTDFKIIGTYS
jgi:hypothetical protein